MSDDFAHAHPNKCHWSAGLPGLCSQPAQFSAYYNSPNARKDWIANLCTDHAKQTIEQKINCSVKERWTGKEIYQG